MMEKTEEVVPMDVWQDRVNQDIANLKSSHTQLKDNQDNMKNDIQKLQLSDKLQDKEISSLKETLSEIKEDTNWIRRKITGAIITATITAVIAGVIGVVVANIF